MPPASVLGAKLVGACCCWGLMSKIEFKVGVEVGALYVYFGAWGT